MPGRATYPGAERWLVPSCCESRVCSWARGHEAMRNPQALTAQIQAESEQFAERLQAVEAREAFTAFAERRPPDFLKLTS
jgi:hypothetical protein